MRAPTDVSDVPPNLGAYTCVDEPADGGLPDGSDPVDASHRCNANESFCLLQVLPASAGGGKIGQCRPYDVGDASAACAFHPTCDCASESHLANCTCDYSVNSVTVICQATTP